jgi:SAM-dependent methyltransferase
MKYNFVRLSVYRLLEIPWIYTLANWALAPGARQGLKRQFDSVFSLDSERVLDVGCGPRLITPQPEGLVAGVDINAAYIKSYAGTIDQDPGLLKDDPKRQPPIYGFVCSATDLPFEENFFDEARTLGLLHHLPDDMAQAAIREMHRCVKPGGCLIVIDNVWPRSKAKRPLAWLTRRFDRGEFIRDESQLAHLIEEAVPGVWRRTRFTYTLTGLEAVSFYLCKV